MLLLSGDPHCPSPPERSALDCTDNAGRVPQPVPSRSESIVRGTEEPRVDDDGAVDQSTPTNRHVGGYRVQHVGVGKDEG